MKCVVRVESAHVQHGPRIPPPIEKTSANKTAAVVRMASGSECCAAAGRELKVGSGSRAAMVVLGALGRSGWE